MSSFGKGGDFNLDGEGGGDSKNPSLYEVLKVHLFSVFGLYKLDNKLY